MQKTKFPKKTHTNMTNRFFYKGVKSINEGKIVFLRNDSWMIEHP
jgi:hypothetical protein